jgi:hypothetical protein
MRKFLVFDADRSLAVIGGPAEQRKLFGVQPIAISRGVEQLEYYLSKLVVKEMVPVMHELAVIFGSNGSEEDMAEPKYRLNLAARQMGLTGIIIDTISTVGQQTREAIMKAKCPKDKDGKQILTMDKQLWGLYGDKMQRFVHLLNQMDFHVIVTCHINRGEDENGGPMDYPDIKGATKESIARYFDVIAYTRVDRNQSGTKYTWQVRPDNRRFYAKDRLSTSEQFVEQDVNQFLTAYEQQGMYCKLLIVGDSGQGKTSSLKTINKPQEAAEGAA